MKIRNKKGFTLTETLLTVILVVLVSGAVAAGISAVTRVIHRIQNKANAEVLMSTTLTLLSDDLKNTESVKNGTDGKLYLKIRENGNGSNAGSSVWINIGNGGKSGSDEEKKGIRKEYYTKAFDPNTGDPVFTDTGDYATYVTEKAKTDTLYTRIDSITYNSDNHVFTISGLEVLNMDGVVQEKLDSFSVAALKTE